MAIKSQNELKKILLEKCKIAVKNTADGVYQEVKDRTVDWYDDYEPVPEAFGGYHRTYQLNAAKNENFVIREAYYSGNSCKETISFDTSGAYKTGKKPSREMVIDTAAQGLHGVKNGEGWKYVSGYNNVKIWDEGLQERAMIELEKALMAQGINIKK